MRLGVFARGSSGFSDGRRYHSRRFAGSFIRLIRVIRWLFASPAAARGTARICGSLSQVQAARCCEPGQSPRSSDGQPVSRERSEGEETSPWIPQSPQSETSLTVLRGIPPSISGRVATTVTGVTSGPTFDASPSCCNGLRGSRGVSETADEWDRPGGIGDAEGDTWLSPDEAV